MERKREGERERKKGLYAKTQHTMKRELYWCVKPGNKTENVELRMLIEETQSQN